jgi:hypothetical protein
MLIELFRHTFTEASTIGTLRIGQKSWHSIEDKDRGLTQQMPLSEIQKVKVYGMTCIPYGMYKVMITQSARFTRMKGRPIFMPQLINVPGFEGIRIHPANLASQLEGCIAPGKGSAKDKVTESRTAYSELLALINTAIKTGEEVWIDIKREL